MGWFDVKEDKDLDYGWGNGKNPIDDLKNELGKGIDTKISDWDKGDDKSDLGGFGW